MAPVSRITRFAIASGAMIGLCGVAAVGGWSIGADAGSRGSTVLAANAAPAIGTTPVSTDLAAPFGGRCSEECENTLSMLSDSDRENLIDLPNRVQHTLKAVDGAKWDGGTRAAVEAAQRLREPDSDSDVAEPGVADTLAAPMAVKSGEADCALRWFGFMNDATRLVGTHRCAISKASDGTVTIEKQTGERFRVHLMPLNDRMSAFAGRSFLAGQPERDYDLKSPVNAGNANFGNVSGLAILSGGQIHLIGGMELGMSSPDDTFFSVMTISGT